MKIYLSIFLITSTVLIGGLYAQNPTLEWVKTFGGKSDAISADMVIDNSGNTYIIGSFVGIADFDSGLGTKSLTSKGSFDVFIQKLDSVGNLCWVKQVGGNREDYGVSLLLDENKKNLYLIGSFVDSVDFDPGVGVKKLFSKNPSRFLLKLDTAGNFKWVKSTGGNQGIATNSATGGIGKLIAMDSNRNIYLTGGFRDTVDFDPGAGVYNLISKGRLDIFIQKLDSSGNFLWVKQFGGGPYYNDIGTSITVTNENDIYVVGGFSDTVDFDPGMGKKDLVSNGYGDIFTLKLDSDGNLLWVKQNGGKSDDYAVSVAIDGMGYVYIVGVFRDTVDFDPGTGVKKLFSPSSFSTFIQKLDQSGTLVWVKQIDGRNGWSRVSSKHIVIDNNSNLYLTGTFLDTVDFDPGIGTMNLISANRHTNDVFSLKLDSLGNLIWVTQISGTHDERSMALVVDSNNSIYLTGNFGRSVDFDPGTGVKTIASQGGFDFFVQKLAQPLSVTVNNLTSETDRFIAFPNPTSENLEIKLMDNFSRMEVSILDYKGKLIRKKEYKNTNTINISFADQASGVYFIEVKSNEKRQVLKVIKN